MTGPHYVRPCRPIRADKPPIGDIWLHEPKLDGYRLQVVKDGLTVRLYSRAGYDWTKRLASVAEAVRAIPCGSAVIDAELCFPSATEAPDFAGLRAALGRRDQHQLAVFAFDLLHLNGRTLLPLFLIERRRRLEQLLDRSNVPCLHLVKCFDDGVKLLEAAERHGLKGIVSKRRGAPYRSGECRDWVTVKAAAGREANWERRRMFERG